MSKRDKNGVQGVQLEATSTTNRKMISSASTTGERTEDDVGEEMDGSMTCDGCNKLISNITGLLLLFCGHFFCLICSPDTLDPTKHVNCLRFLKSCPLFTRESSPTQRADHDGELSQETGGDKTKMAQTTDNNGGESSRTGGSKTPKKEANRSESGRKKRRRSQGQLGRQQLWYFTYEKRPVVVSLPYEATYGDLLNRLCLMLNIEKSCHQMRVKTQKSSSEEGDGELAQAAEPVVLEVANSKCRLAELKIPRKKMLILEVMERKTSDKKEKIKEERKEFLVEEPMSTSLSKAEEPKS